MILLILALGPVLLLLHFFYVRDLHEREAVNRVVKVFLLGMLAVIPAIALEMIFQAPASWGLAGVAINAFLLIALPEELSKLWLFRLYVEKHRSYNEVYDGIIYMVAISLGFATVENLAYVYGSGQDAIAVALMRGILAVPGHTLWAVMMGFFLGLSRFGRTKYNPRLLLYIGLGMAIFWHGLYDFFAFSIEALPESMTMSMLAGCLTVIIVNWVIALVYVSRAQKLSSFTRPSPIQNPIAAVRSSHRYCGQCGKMNLRTNVDCNACGKTLQ